MNRTSIRLPGRNRATWVRIWLMSLAWSLGPCPSRFANAESAPSDTLRTSVRRQARTFLASKMDFNIRPPFGGTSCPAFYLYMKKNAEIVAALRSRWCGRTRHPFDVYGDFVGRYAVHGKSNLH